MSIEQRIFVEKIKERIDLEIYNEVQRIRQKENRNETEDQLYSKYFSWDKGDCSIVGLLTILTWYVSSIENGDLYRNNEYKELIEFLNNIKF